MTGGAGRTACTGLRGGCFGAAARSAARRFLTAAAAGLFLAAFDGFFGAGRERAGLLACAFFRAVLGPFFGPFLALLFGALFGPLGGRADCALRARARCGRDAFDARLAGFFVRFKRFLGCRAASALAGVECGPVFAREL